MTTRSRVNVWRATPAIATALATVLLAAGVSIAVVAQSVNVRQKQKEVMLQADILASTVTAALSFDDAHAAQEYVDALRANQDILQAAVYDSAGSRFASFYRPPASEPPAQIAELPPQPGENRMDARAGVQEEGKPLGSVYLNVIVERANRRYMRLGVIVLLATMMAVIVAVLGIAHRTLTRVNDRLEQRSRELAETNASLQQQIYERERVEQALRQAQKMESIGQLTGGVAHDFNNLLQIILSSLGAAQRKAAQWNLPDETLRDFNRTLDMATAGGERAAALTRQLLAFARKQPLEPVKLDVNALVSNLSELLRRTLGEAVMIETVLANDIWPVFADQNQLASALLNLAVNARDAMAGSGTLTIETRNMVLDEAYAASQLDVRAGEYVQLAVADNGIGMTPDVLSRVFEPFFTTKDVGHGTGLGLSQVYGFVKQTGGHIRIDSKPGRGSCVLLYLPRLTTPEPEPAPLKSTSQLPTARGNETILVVEDEEDVRSQSVEMLRELGYTVVSAEDGPSALRAIEADQTVTLLFTDVGLPGGMNGNELASELRRRNPDMRVLFTSGYTRDAIARDGRLEPGVALLGKPFTFESLACKIRDVLDG